MRYGNIYIIKNKINKKIYIGQTLLDIHTRFNLHIAKSKSGRNSKLYKAIREYGKDNFEISLLESNIPISALDSKEKEYIQSYNSIKEGYNTSIGGDGRTIYSNIDELKILNMVSMGKSTKEIAKFFNVSVVTIQRCLVGKGLNRSIKLTKESDEKIKELWNNNTIQEIANYFNVNEKTIRRHAKKMGLKKR